MIDCINDCNAKYSVPLQTAVTKSTATFANRLCDQSGEFSTASQSSDTADTDYSVSQGRREPLGRG